MGEDALQTDPLEPTNQWYAIVKIAGIKLCQANRHLSTECKVRILRANGVS